jgi:hypothetical protein
VNSRVAAKVNSPARKGGVEAKTEKSASGATQTIDFGNYKMFVVIQSALILARS